MQRNLKFLHMLSNLSISLYEMATMRYVLAGDVVDRVVVDGVEVTNASSGK